MTLFETQENEVLSRLPSEKFETQWRAESRVLEVGVASVDDFISRHYLHKRPAIVLGCLAMLTSEIPVGCIIFSAPSPEASVRYGGETWELARLYLLDRVPKNAETWLIAKGVNHVRRHHPEVKMLLSYADPAAGHSGTIYKAANWKFDGMTDEERQTPRCDYVDGNTGKKYGRRGNMPQDAKVQRVARGSKFRFIYPLR